MKAIKRNIFREKVSQLEFGLYVLNLSKKSTQMLFNFHKYRLTAVNVVFVNAIYRWLNDDDRLEKFIEDKQSGEFSFLTEDIDENVINYFSSSE